MDDQATQTLLQACRALLRPIVRLLLRSGVSWRDFAETARETFVDVASMEFGIRGRPTNVSRVAILTGIARRDVRKLRRQLAEPAANVPEYLNPATRVLSGWHQDAAFMTQDSRPKELTLEEGDASFAELCRRYGGDVPRGALLKELIAVGAVEKTAAGRLIAKMRVYIPRQVDPAKVLRAGSVLADAGNTVVYDLLCKPRDPLRFERRAANESIDPKHLPAFRDFLESEGMAFLERVDDWLTQHEARNSSTSGPARIRVGVGVYHIQGEIERGSST